MDDARGVLDVERKMERELYEASHLLAELRPDLRTVKEKGASFWPIEIDRLLTNLVPAGTTLLELS